VNIHSLAEEQSTKNRWCLAHGRDICRDDGWLVWLRRIDNKVDFDQGWSTYKSAFGNKKGNFWLGLDELHKLTNNEKRFQLKAWLESYMDGFWWAEYRFFHVGRESEKYRMTVQDFNFKSTAPDQLYYNNGKDFITKDRDNTNRENPGCATFWQGAFWYKRYNRSEYAGTDERLCSKVYPTVKFGVLGIPREINIKYVSWYNATGKIWKDPQQQLKSLTLMMKPHD